MRVVFLGTPRVAVPSLTALVESGHELVSVVTRVDRPVGRSGRLQAPPVKVAAAELGLEVLQPTRVKTSAFVDEIARRRPEVLVVVAYGRILTPALLAVPPAGAINIHFSLLPRHRGAAPVQWALAHGDRETGVTTMQINERLDEGDLLMQRRMAIRPGEHAPALQERLATDGAELLIETLEKFREGTLDPRPQDSAAASYAPLLTTADGAVDPAERTASEIEGRVRGFDPWPGVWLEQSGKRLRILEASATSRPPTAAAPGTVLGLEGEALLLACAAGSSLEVSRLQFEGRRAMTARDAVNGRQIADGDRLSRPGVPCSSRGC